jgi:hypothetical protein
LITSPSRSTARQRYWINSGIVRVLDLLLHASAQGFAPPNESDVLPSVRPGRESPEACRHPAAGQPNECRALGVKLTRRKRGCRQRSYDQRTGHFCCRRHASRPMACCLGHHRRPPGCPGSGQISHGRNGVSVARGISKHSDISATKLPSSDDASQRGVVGGRRRGGASREEGSISCCSNVVHLCRHA